MDWSSSIEACFHMCNLCIPADLPALRNFVFFSNFLPSPTVWNSLSVAVGLRDPALSSGNFRQSLKTEHFAEYAANRAQLSWCFLTLRYINSVWHWHHGHTIILLDGPHQPRAWVVHKYFNGMGDFWSGWTVLNHNKWYRIRMPVVGKYRIVVLLHCDVTGASGTVRYASLNT